MEAASFLLFEGKPFDCTSSMLSINFSGQQTIKRYSGQREIALNKKSAKLL
jgi:hypothetical protein